jgi:hypothetical protein
MVLLPLAMEGKEKEFRGTVWITTIARLKDSTGLREAQADLDLTGSRIHSRISEHTGWRMEAQPLLSDLVGPVEPAPDALFGAVLLALLIACANIARLRRRGQRHQRSAQPGQRYLAALC